VLQNLTFDHAGTYDCVAYNAFLDVQVRSPKIIVGVKGTTCFV